MQIVKEMQKDLTMMIYQTQLSDKSFEAQTTYQYLADVMQIIKGEGRRDILTHEHLDTAETLFLEVLRKNKSALNYEQIKNDIDSLLALAAEYIPKTPVERNVKVSKRNTEMRLAELEKELEEKNIRIKQWEDGWLSGESIKNEKYRRLLEEIIEVAQERNYDPILALTAQVINSDFAFMVNDGEELKKWQKDLINQG